MPAITDNSDAPDWSLVEGYRTGGSHEPASPHGPRNPILSDGLCQSWRRCASCRRTYNDLRNRNGTDAMEGF